MSSISERLRARLSEKRLAKPERVQEIKENSNGQRRQANSAGSGDDVCDSISNGNYVIYTLGARDYEGARSDLRIACILYVRARRYLYQNYMESAFLVFRGLIDEEAIERWMESYCQEPYPDVCCCGTRFISNHGIVRSHCIGCIGDNVGLAYDMQRLSQELRIHYSWIEYGFAWALSQVGGVKI